MPHVSATHAPINLRPSNFFRSAATSADQVSSSVIPTLSHAKSGLSKFFATSSEFDLNKPNAIRSQKKYWDSAFNSFHLNLDYFLHGRLSVQPTSSRRYAAIT